MHDARARAHESLGTFATAWLAGNAEPAMGVLAPAVQWWAPLPEDVSTGPDGAWAALETIIATVPRPVRVSALILNEEGTRGVIELRADAETGLPATLVTSVVRLADASIIEGFTYSDVDPGFAGATP